MDVLRVVAAGSDVLAHGTSRPLESVLRDTLAEVSPEARVVVLVRGFKWSPAATELGAPLKDPFCQIFSTRPQHINDKVVSWPQGLGAAQRGDLVIAFGWQALSGATLGRVPARGFQQIYERAGQTGQALKALVDQVRAVSPGREVGLLAHSLGARVALEAARLGAGIGRMVLMAGAETKDAAEATLTAAPTTEVLNVTPRTNAFYDRLFAWSIPCEGQTLANLTPRDNHMPLITDGWSTRDALAQLGYRIDLPDRRMCHWSYYSAPGLLGFYGDVLNGTLRLRHLAVHLDVLEKVRTA